MPENLREQIFKQFSDARRRTLEIYELAADETVLHESPGFGFRPILWHLAHLGAFEEYWVAGKIAGKDPINERFQIIFDPVKTPRESSKNLPTKTEMLAYLNEVRDGTFEVLDGADFDSKNELLRDGYVFDLVYQHELQHQETLAYLFHLLPLEKNRISDSGFRIPFEISKTENRTPKTVEFAAGEFQIGAKKQEFVYDNEMSAHQKIIPAFRLDKFLTTNAEFAEFIAEDGYARAEFWSDEGRIFRKKENWSAPLYWRKNENDWLIRTFSQEKSLNDSADFPVYGVSFYEAEAYARFRGKRLPNEFERERAAADLKSEPTPENCNFDFNFWDTTPVGNFSLPDDAAADLRGNLWEWTTSHFAPYPGFEPFPYPEYSAEWFDGDHRVLRGGSWATSKEMLRPTFRNFFRRGFRVAFAGIRLAEDV